MVNRTSTVSRLGKAVMTPRTRTSSLTRNQRTLLSDVAEADGLAQQDGLQADQFEHGEEGADEGALGLGARE